MTHQIEAFMNPHEIAEVIFNKFELLQSGDVKGFIIVDGKLRPKGDCVRECLELLDRKSNCYRTSGGTVFRKKRKPAINYIGGYAAQKGFTYRHVVIDDEPKWTFWRVQ